MRGWAHFGICCTLAWGVLAARSRADVDLFRAPHACGERDAFRARVLALAGPEQSFARAHVEIEVDRERRMHHLALRVETETETLAREFVDESCPAVIEAAAIVTALALRDQLPEVPAAPPPLQIEIVAVRVESLPDPEPPRIAPSQSIEVRAAFGIQGGLGVLPSLALGVRLGASLTYDLFEISLGATYWPTRFAALDGESGVSVWALDGWLAATLRGTIDGVSLSLGPLLELGAIGGRGVGVDVPTDAVELVVAPGLTSLVRVPLMDRVEAYCAISASIPLQHVALALENRGIAYSTPLARAQLGAGISVRLW